MKPDKTKGRQAIKTGQSFERLIARIQKSVHDRAEIGVNEKLKDVDTGRLRQIDITIRLSDGPTQFLGIVEVRDRSRPIGVRYVEEISGKQRSVRADAAFLVSKSGFTKTAITKATQLAIRTLSYEEAQEADWSNWLQCRTFGVLSRKYDKPVITIFEKGEKDKVIEMSPESIAELKKNKTTKIILDKDGNALFSLPELINRIVNIYGEQPFENIPHDGSRIRTPLLFNEKFDPPIYLKAKDGQIRQIGNIGLVVELYFESEEYPIKLTRYKETDSSSSIAELATADVNILGKKYRFEILVPKAGDCVPEGAAITFHSIPLSDDEENKRK